MKLSKTIILFPVVILIIGDIIHLVNFIRMYYGTLPVTLWTVWVNVSMMIINTGLLTGLVKKMHLAYYTTIIMFSLFSITQVISLFAMETIKLQNAVTVSISSATCLAAALFMLSGKKHFIVADKKQA